VFAEIFSEDLHMALPVTSIYVDLVVEAASPPAVAVAAARTKNKCLLLLLLYT
jgi:hypothetical protein